MYQEYKSGGIAVYNPHPIADIFPLIQGKDFVDLKTDIKEKGLLEPIWIYQGKILDGRNRFRACQEAGVTIEFREYQGTDPLGFVISLNLKRRHLDESQRAMVAARIAIVSKELQDAQQEIKNQWINQARQMFTPGKKESCFICNKYKSVVHAHHLIPLSRQDINSPPNHDFVWLCPTHHAGVHQLIGYTSWPDWDGFSDEEKKLMTEIASKGL